MLIIADTGPLISLIQLEHLNVLVELYPEFILPEQVYEELANHPPIQDFPASLLILQPHIRKTSLLPNPEFSALHKGEQACLALYYELKADAILIEDKDARSFAENRGIICYGTLGLLVKAKQKGLIKELRPLFIQMRAQRRFISEQLFNQILRDAGEI